MNNKVNNELNGNRRVLAPKIEIFGWAMFDFANSSYTTVILTVVYAIIFPQLIVGNDSSGEFRDGNFLWSIALSISYLFVVISAPVFGAIMDFSASKKKFLFASYILTVLATAALYMVKPGDYMLGMILIVISCYGFLSGESFVSSFLPNLGPPEDLGKISGYAWGLGYFGGLFSVILVSMLGELSLENYENLRLVGPVTGLFFLVAAIPTFILLKEKKSPRKLPSGSTYFGIAIKRLAQTFRDLKDFRDLIVFLCSMFFATAGLNIVITFAFIYGAQVIKWSETARVLMFVITQFTAAGGAVLFGFIQDKIGAKKTFNITLILWIVAIILIWASNDITALINNLLGGHVKNETTFLFIGSLAGMGLGATQSASRAMVGIFTPESKSGEFFGFWGLSGKMSGIFGIMSIGILQSFFGLQKSILICSLYFFIAMCINIFVNEENGKRAAVRHEGN